MIKSNIADPASGIKSNVAPTSWGNALCVTNFETLNARFKSATHSTATTTIISQPSSGGSISLTDLIVTAERRAAGGSLTLRFTDGTNTINIAVASVTDAPVAFALGFSGKWQGWLNARLEMVTDQAFPVTVSVGYLKVAPQHTLLYAAWDAQR